MFSANVRGKKNKNLNKSLKKKKKRQSQLAVELQPSLDFLCQHDKPAGFFSTDYAGKTINKQVYLVQPTGCDIKGKKTTSIHIFLISTKLGLTFHCQIHYPLVYTFQ